MLPSARPGPADAAYPRRLGDVLAGRYRLDGLLGEGGFGVVYRATALDMGRVVALKVVRPEMLLYSDGLERFRREAQLAQRLSHPNTVRVYDFGHTEQGVPFIAWEMLEGESLEQAVRREGRLAPDRVLRIASQILKSLMEAHHLGIVHRDIKPANVFLCRFVHGEADFVKVLDFGIAKSTRSRSMGALTEQGMMIGSPSYMAPEQVRGDEISPRTDVYAVGLLVAEMLTGAPVFRGRSGVDVCMAQLSDAPAPIPHEVLSGPFGPLVHRATQKNPLHRFSSAHEMFQALEAVQLAARSSGYQPPPTPMSYAPTGYVATPLPGSMPAGSYAPAAPTAASPLGPPKPKGRGGLIAAVVVLSLLLIVAGGAAVLAATGNLGGSLGPSASLSELTPDQIKARVERAGFRVLTAAPMTILQTKRWTWNAQSKDADATVHWVHFADVLSAKIEQETCMGAATREGSTVLCVEVDMDDVKSSKKLLDKIMQ